MHARSGILAITVFALIAAGATAEPLICDEAPLEVHAADPALAERTCEAAARVLPLLAECGVVLARAQTIEIRDAIPGAPDCMGVYHCDADRIELLAPEAMDRLRRQDGAFHALSTPAFFESVLAHELAHAAYDPVPCPFSDCLVTSEYVAYAMQVRSLPSADRAIFETALNLEERVSRYEFSSVGLLMAPDSFARDVWVHFSQREDGCAYVADMMRAEFHLDSPRP